MSTSKKNYEVTLKIERKGFLSGSVGYVSNKLSNASLLQKKDGVYVHYLKGKKQDGTEVFKDEKICGVIQSTEILCHAREFSNKIWIAYTYDEDLGNGYEKYTLFDCVLTEKAKQIAEEFLNDVAAKFEEMFDSE